MRGFQKRLSDAFKGQSLPMLPVAVQLEASSGTGRLHMHGVVITDGHDVMKVKQALREAAGYIRGRAGSRQCALRSLTESDGWTAYILKDLAYTDRQTPGRLTYINTPMKQRAQQLHQQSRGKALSANSNECPLDESSPPTDYNVAAVKDTILETADQLSEEDDLRMKSNPFYGMFRLFHPMPQKPSCGRSAPGSGGLGLCGGGRQTWPRCGRLQGVRGASSRMTRTGEPELAKRHGNGRRVRPAICKCELLPSAAAPKCLSAMLPSWIAI